MSELNTEQEIEFNFDEWMELFKNDPERFEKKRKDMISLTIDHAPTRMHRRLKGLQWTIDSEVQLAKNPLQGCIKVYEMMMDSVYKPGGLQDALSMSEIEVKKSVAEIRKIKNDFESR